MSTQRRENRPTPATESLRGRVRLISTPVAFEGRRGFRDVSRLVGRRERDGYNKIPVAQFDLVHASGVAAPPVDLALLHNANRISLGTPAAPSLQADCSNTSLVEQVPRGTCCGRSPQRAGRHDTSLLRLRLTGFSEQSPFPILRVSIPPCRGYRQH
jgi:hypothetical protein